MMRRLFLIATLLFWLAIAFFWLGSRFAARTPPAPAPAPVQSITLAEVARHASPEDCWMVIDGGVYDVTDYLPEHPSKPSVIEPWCGREATEAYRTKTKGRPHSSEADLLLPSYRIGNLSLP